MLSLRWRFASTQDMRPLWYLCMNEAPAQVILVQTQRKAPSFKSLGIIYISLCALCNISQTVLTNECCTKKMGQSAREMKSP